MSTTTATVISSRQLPCYSQPENRKVNLSSMSSSSSNDISATATTSASKATEDYTFANKYKSAKNRLKSFMTIVRYEKYRGHITGNLQTAKWRYLSKYGFYALCLTEHNGLLVSCFYCNRMYCIPLTAVPRQLIDKHLACPCPYIKGYRTSYGRLQIQSLNITFDKHFLYMNYNIFQNRYDTFPSNWSQNYSFLPPARLLALDGFVLKRQAESCSIFCFACNLQIKCDINTKLSDIINTISGSGSGNQTDDSPSSSSSALTTHNSSNININIHNHNTMETFDEYQSVSSSVNIHHYEDFSEINTSSESPIHSSAEYSRSLEDATTPSTVNVNFESHPTSSESQMESQPVNVNFGVYSTSTSNQHQHCHLSSTSRSNLNLNINSSLPKTQPSVEMTTFPATCNNNNTNKSSSCSSNNSSDAMSSNNVNTITTCVAPNETCLIDNLSMSSLSLSSSATGNVLPSVLETVAAASTGYLDVIDIHRNLMPNCLYIYLKYHSTIKTADICIICNEFPVTMAYNNCNHAVSCYSCTPALSHCPICRAAINFVKPLL